MKKRLHRQNRKILILDLFSMTIAYVLALTIRFFDWWHMGAWQVELYMNIYVLEIMIYLILYVAVDRHKKNQRAIHRMDPAEILVNVFKIQCLEVVLLFAVLGAVQMMARSSRRFLLYNFLLCLVLVSAERLLYRRHRIRKAGKEPVLIHYLLVTTKEDVIPVVRQLRNTMQDAGQLDAVMLIDENGSAVPADRSEYDHVPVITDVHTLCGEGTGRSYMEAFLYLPGFTDRQRLQIVSRLTSDGISSALCLTAGHNSISKQMIHTVGTYQAAVFTGMKERCRIFGINYNVANVDAAVIYCKSHIRELKGQYICFSNVHTSVMARENPAYCNVQNSAAFTFPDGVPIAMIENQRERPGASRVSGPDFMGAMFRETCDGSLSHYFYGSTPETIELLKEKLPERYPGIRIAGVESPPFRKLTKEEDEEAIRRINASGADIVWIGLGAPKQEEWMYEHRGRLNGVMCGVGAGFNFYAGNVRRAPVWMQHMSLEWLYRLFQDPKRLFGRYVKTNLKFFYYYLKDREWRNQKS